MVVGNGLIAEAFDKFKHDNNILIFASGVSNSLEQREEEFERESGLLKATIKSNQNKKLVYFSTCSIDDSSVNHRPYVQHKLKMEKMVQDLSNDYLIFRLSNVVGKGGNSNTILNYLFFSVKNEREVNLWRHASRNILGIDDVFEMVDKVLNQTHLSNKVMNLANCTTFNLPYIIERIESFLNKKAVINYLDKGKPVNIDITALNDIIKEVIDERKLACYIDDLLIKYFSHEQ